MWFKRKTENKPLSKEEEDKKVLEDIKTKKEQIIKLKKEIVDMGKYALKDGKLVKTEDIEPQVPQPPQQQAQPVQQQYVPPVQQPTDVQEAQYYEAVRKTVIPTPQPRQMPQEYAAPYPIVSPEEDFVIQEPRQQQYQPQPRQQVQRVENIIVHIEMITGQVIQLEVELEKLQSFIEDMNGAIDGQTSLPLGNKTINGRNVVSYTIIE